MSGIARGSADGTSTRRVVRVPIGKDLTVIRMHHDDVETDAGLVRRLLAAQFPRWADLPIEPVEPQGTDNAIYRIGEDMVVRLPRRRRTAVTLEKERAWLPRLAPRLPLATPTPLAEGAPAEEYPFVWSVYGWLDGAAAAVEPFADPGLAAIDLARFVTDLQRIDPAGGPAPGEHNFFRGEPLAARDAAVRASIDRLRDELDVEAVTDIWAEALGAAAWRRAPVWIHGDLDRRNLLVAHGRLSAVIDWGGLGVGDPACDVMVAWKVLSAESRGAFRTALSVDEATWTRARGWALSQTLGALSYYTEETNPVLVGEARGWLAEVVTETDARRGRRPPTPLGSHRTMVPEAPLEATETGLRPRGEGWFVVNAREARWRDRPGRGYSLPFERPTDFPQIGITLFVLGSDEPIGMYHWESNQEDFLILSGEALLLVEGEERPLRQWDFVHCPLHTKHIIIIGAGDGPCAVLAVGAREEKPGEDWGGYTVDEVATRHGAGVEAETNDAEEA